MLHQRSFLSAALALLASTALFENVAAQVKTDCQPLNKTCPPDPAFGMDFNFNFNQTPVSNTWEQQNNGKITYDNTGGASLILSQQKDAPTLRSKFYIFFGRVEMWIKVASGTGIISSVMLLSDDLDEIDVEFKGGEPNMAYSNYYGRGVIVDTNGGNHPVDSGVQDDFHNYTLYWTKDVLQWYIDGALVRTLTPEESLSKNYTFPQTPSRISLGIWAGGDPDLPKGTREWAGGDTDYKAGPFTMGVKSVHVTDFNQGLNYTYGDRSGNWESIKIIS
jgi:beta-glucanase (GH16 family)